MTVARSTTSSAAPAPRIHVRAAQASSGDRPSAAHAPGPSALPLASARAHAIATGMPTPTSSSDAPRATAARSAPLACRPCGQAPSRTARKDAMLLTSGLTGGAPTTWHAGLVSLDPAWHQGRAEAHCTGGDRSRSAVADGDGHVIEAACISTLVALRPPLGAWYPRCQTSFLAPSAAADSGELQQAGRRDTTRSFGMSSKVCVGWAASAITPGRQSLNGRAADGDAPRSRY
jgi:hypothetical protein